jgi:hypothetical protein
MSIKTGLGVVALAAMNCGGVVGPADAGTDAADAPVACTDPTTCTPSAPRLVSPHSTGVVTSRRPTFRFVPAANATSYELDLCADVACNTLVATIPTTTTSAQPSSPLPAHKPIFWRVIAKHDAFQTTSATWEVFVGNGDAPHDTSWLGPPDFDRDGLVDVALGSASNDVYVMMNKSGTGLPASDPTATLPGGSGFGRATANAGDVNGDGYGDLIVGSIDPVSPRATFLAGGPTGVDPSPTILPVAPNTMNIAVGGAGDVDGDGYADVLVSSNSLTSLFRGGPTGPAITPSGGPLNGGSGSGAGDVNADGFADVIVCDGSTATVYFGSASGLGKPQIIPAPSGANGFGEECITAGDVNGDGYADVMVATLMTASVYVFYGGPNGASTASPALLAGASGSGAGGLTSIAPAGDVNGDGFGDVIVGAYNANSVFVYPGGASGVSSTALSSFTTLPQGQYGSSVAAIGDADADGFDDIAFAPGQCTGFPVLAYSGSANGLTSTALRTWNAPQGAQCYGIIAR